MKSSKIMVAAAALSGLLAGSSVRAVTVSTSSHARSQISTTAGQKAVAMDDTGKHDCKGKNACKGQGGCKTGDQGCKGKNSCKGNGGCKTAEDSTSQKSVAL